MIDNQLLKKLPEGEKGNKFISMTSKNLNHQPCNTSLNLLKDTPDEILSRIGQGKYNVNTGNWITVSQVLVQY